MATGKPVVLVLINGRPLDITWASQHVPAILDVWYPGTEGGNAIADLLFGDAMPGGKLPVSWPRDVGQVPIYYAQQSNADSRGSGYAVLGRIERAAVSVWLWPELHELLAWRE